MFPIVARRMLFIFATGLFLINNAGCTHHREQATRQAVADVEPTKGQVIPPVVAPADRKYTIEDATLQRAVDEAHAEYRGLSEGKNADYIPALAKVDSKLFGVVIVTVDGKVFTAGDATAEFSIQSISKVFVAAMVMNDIGAQALKDKIGVEPTGLPFNSILAIELLPKTRPTNPLVNAGAIATTSLAKGDNAGERWESVLTCLRDFAARDLTLIDEVYKSEAETNLRNRSIATLLANYGRVYSDPLEATDIYTKQCSVGVSAKDLAIMGATLANNGVNPITKKKLMKPADVPALLAVMTMAGFYDESGAWAYEVGLPAKTGVGGGIVAVVPGKMAIAAFSPPVNDSGNSVRAQRAIKMIAKRLGVNVFAE